MGQIEQEFVQRWRSPPLMGTHRHPEVSMHTALKKAVGGPRAR